MEIDTKEIRMHRGVLLKHFSARDDGGSEFAAEFEEACQQKQLPLFVLPPKSPKLNGHVERSHRTHNEEFYQVHAQSDQVPVRNRPRRFGQSKYGIMNRAFVAFADLLVVRWMKSRLFRYEVAEDLGGDGAGRR